MTVGRLSRLLHASFCLFSADLQFHLHRQQDEPIFYEDFRLYHIRQCFSHIALQWFRNLGLWSQAIQSCQQPATKVIIQAMC